MDFLVIKQAYFISATYPNLFSKKKIHNQSIAFIHNVFLGKTKQIKLKNVKKDYIFLLRAFFKIDIRKARFLTKTWLTTFYTRKFHQFSKKRNYKLIYEIRHHQKFFNFFRQFLRRI